MRRLAALARGVFTALFCLSLVVWSVRQEVSHTPAVIETIQDHLEMIADHGHSHGFADDLYWAMHGHSHDVADHDHSQASLLTGAASDPDMDFRKAGRRLASLHGPSRQFRIDRPPRA